MSTIPRRRVLRLPPPETAPYRRANARFERRRVQLAKDRIALKRWLTRLRRAANSVIDLHARIARLETALASDKC
jgi:hypothetical protein